MLGHSPSSLPLVLVAIALCSCSAGEQPSDAADAATAPDAQIAQDAGETAADAGDTTPDAGGTLPDAGQPACAELTGAACEAAGCRLYTCEAGAFCLEPIDEPCGVCPDTNGCGARNTAACAAHHDDADACNAAGCAHYGCAFAGKGGCFARTGASAASGCAVCPAVYGSCSGCEQFDRDPAACAVAELGCRYYEACGGGCMDATAFPCEACPAVSGCDLANTAGCEAEHGDLEGCSAIQECAYYACGFLSTGACFPRGSDGCAICPETYCL